MKPSLHFAGEAALWMLRILVPLALLLLLLAARTGRLRPIYRAHFPQSPRERLFLASLSFFLTFATVRAITRMIRAGMGPFHDITAGGRHIHHLVFGISLLLIVGYLWLVQIGTGKSGTLTWTGRLTAVLYGIAAALTLDEFALWLNLRDVYWQREGRASVDIALLFGSLLSVGVWGGRFFHGLTRHALDLSRKG